MLILDDEMMRKRYYLSLDVFYLKFPCPSLPPTPGTGAQHHQDQKAAKEKKSKRRRE